MEQSERGYTGRGGVPFCGFVCFFVGLWFFFCVFFQFPLKDKISKMLLVVWEVAPQF